MYLERLSNRYLLPKLVTNLLTCLHYIQVSGTSLNVNSADNNVLFLWLFSGIAMCLMIDNLFCLYVSVFPIRSLCIQGKKICAQKQSGTQQAFYSVLFLTSPMSFIDSKV